MNKVRYIVISPVRDEQDYIRNTIQSLASQTSSPELWIIVDDGSKDDTGRITDEASAKYNWIKVLHRQDSGLRRAGGGVMQAFYAGFELIGHQKWEFLVKLDGDITCEPDYFERCFGRFKVEPRLGIGGGLVCNQVDGALCPESTIDPKFHVRGATKIYRRECWLAIGGLAPATGWDTIDELKANMMGWSTRTFHEIKVLHLTDPQERPMAHGPTG
jgi:biofilm PGA synthesis N-glycosyltransferase PgaC